MLSVAARRTALALFAALTLSHCAELPAPPATRAPVVPAATTPPEAPVPPLLLAYPLLDQPALQAYVDAVADRLSPFAGHADAWTTGVIDRAEPSVHVLPDARIYLSRGLLAYLHSEADLAAVLAGAMAHASAGHAPQTRPTLPGLLGPAPDFDALRSTTYAPSDRNEADALAARYLAQSGYEPRALMAISGRHDEVRKRIVELARADGTRYRIDRDAYLDAITGLPWGESARLGALDGTTLRHAGWGVQFSFPAGWQIVREPGRIVARAGDGSALIELVPVTEAGTPAALLQKLLATDPGARFDSGDINGLAAAFAVGAIQGRPLLASALKLPASTLIVAVQSRDRDTYLRDRAALRAALNSVRPLPAADAVAETGWRLDTVRLDAETPFARLVAESPLGPNAAAELRKLNGLGPRAEPRAGMRLKIVR